MASDYSDSENPLGVAAGVLARLSQDENEWEILRRRRIEQQELQAKYRAAKRKGRAEGRAEGKIAGIIEGRVEGRIEGRAEGRIESILAVTMNLITTSLDTNKIAEITGLTCEEVKNIRSLIKRFSNEWWDPFKNEIFTLEGITTSDLRVAVINEFLKTRNEWSGS